MSASPQGFTQILITAFLGLLVASFIGFGISAFYPAPEYPSYPRELNKPTATESPEQIELRETYDKKLEEHKEARENYNRLASGIALAAAVLVLIISLTAFRSTPVMADGLLLGGVFTILYSLGHALASNDPRFQFIIVTVGLVIAFTIVYLKFVKPAKEKAG